MRLSLLLATVLVLLGEGRRIAAVKPLRGVRLALSSLRRQVGRGHAGRPPPAPRWLQQQQQEQEQEQQQEQDEATGSGDCPDIDQGHNCDEWFASRPDEYTCEFLEGMGFDCSGCLCGEEDPNDAAAAALEAAYAEDYMEEEALVEGKTAENVIAGVIAFLFVCIFCVMLHSQKSKGAAKGHWLKRLFGFAGSSGNTKIHARPAAGWNTARAAAGAVAQLSRARRARRVLAALQQECQNAKNGRQRRDVLDLMREKLRKAGEAMIADVEEEEHEAALEHGDAETAAAAAEKKSMKDLTGKLMGAQKAAQGLQLTDDHHTHLRKRALAGCTARRTFTEHFQNI